MNNDTFKTILLVEDEAIISIVVSKTLKRLGYNVLTAGSGERAVELSASESAVDLILMDINLGSGIDGTEAAKQILLFRDIPIVFHTSHSERDMVDRVRGITRYGYVIKSSGDFVLQSSIEMAFELVQAHKKIKASEEHFYSMFEKAPLGYQSLDENGCFIEINQKWVETLGYSRDEVVGKWFGDFLAPEFVEAFRERFPLFKAQGKIHSEFQMIHKNGSRRYIAFEGRIGYQDDGSFQQTHCILSDETERKFAEEELRQTRATLQAAMDQSPAGIAIADVPDGKLRYVNDAGLLIRGGSRQEIVDGVGIDKYVSSWKITDFDGRPLEVDEIPLARAVLYGDTCSREFIIRRSIEDERIVLANAAPIKDANGNVEAGIVVFTDITERKRSEDEIKLKNEELASLNEELTAALEEMEAANEELTAAMEEMEAANEELYATNERLTESEREIERSEEKFRQMFFQHHAVMLLIDPTSGCIVDANQSAELFYGYELDQFRRMKIQDINTLSIEMIDAEMRRAKDDKRTHFIFPHMLANSEIRTVEVYSSPVTINENKLLFSIIHDITERTIMEEELKMNRELLKETEQTGKIGGWIFDVATLTQKWTEETFRILEVDLTDGEPVVPDGVNFFAPQSRLVVEQAIQRAIEYGEPYDLELEVITAKGNRRWVHSVAKPHLKEGRTATVSGSFQDITDRKKTENDLRISEERYTAALAAVDDGIWDWYVPDGKAFFNEQYFKILGYENGEFTASYNSWRSLVHPDDIDRVENELKQSTDNGLKFGTDLRMKMKSGEWLWVCTRGKVVETDSEGKTLRMVGTLSDVTLRKKVENELRESQDNLARIIENSSDLICEIDDCGKYTFVSERYKDVLGYTPGELIGRHTIEKIHPDEIELVKEKYRELKMNSGTSVEEWRFLHKNGRYHTFECRGSVYNYVDGRPRMVVISHDITRTKQIEDAQLFLIVSGSQLSGGGDFFHSLAKYLAETLKMDYVCIDRFVGNGLAAKTVAVYFDGEFEDNMEYTLKDTPCGAVAGKTICTFEENVSGLFPHDIVLKEMKAESYAGVTLWSSSGTPIGLIAVISRDKMEDSLIAESILKIVAIRAASELERRDDEEKIKNLLLEKEILLKEVHHRIKNNMSTINGLLALQADSVTDPAAIDALKDAESRVQSMMVLYDKLYRSDNFNQVSVKEYLPGLITEISGNFPNSKNIKIESQIGDFILEVKNLVPIGIIVNELLTNTMKYAFAGRDGGVIKISAELNGSKAQLIIEDNGIGIPESVTFENSTGFGMQLVGMLTEQIDGIIRIERGEGTRFVLEFAV